jgi:ArsR family transcriptional regulator
MLNHPAFVERSDLVLALKALAHPSRLQIIDLLMGGVHCNCELAAQLGLAPNLLSYHLRLLEEAGLIASERDALDARWVYYTMQQPALIGLRETLGALLDPARIQPRQPNCGPRHCDSQHCDPRRCGSA